MDTSVPVDLCYKTVFNLNCKAIIRQCLRWHVKPTDELLLNLPIAIGERGTCRDEATNRMIIFHNFLISKSFPNRTPALIFPLLSAINVVFFNLSHLRLR